jgi:hypothetical protein
MNGLSGRIEEDLARMRYRELLQGYRCESKLPAKRVVQRKAQRARSIEWSKVFQRSSSVSS